MTDDKKKLWEWGESPVMLVDGDGMRPSTMKYRRHLDRSFYAWDEWQQRAKAAGVAEDLAQLGRSLMREADQHSWPEELQAECGWDDDGATMIALAVADPTAARDRWSWLMNTDGERVDPVTFEPLDEENDDADEDEDEDRNENEDDAGNGNRH